MDSFRAGPGWNWFYPVAGGYWSVALVGSDVWNVSWISWYMGLCSPVLCSEISCLWSWCSNKTKYAEVKPIFKKGDKNVNLTIDLFLYLLHFQRFLKRSFNVCSFSAGVQLPSSCWCVGWALMGERLRNKLFWRCTQCMTLFLSQLTQPADSLNYYTPLLSMHD